MGRRRKNKRAEAQKGEKGERGKKNVMSPYYKDDISPLASF